MIYMRDIKLVHAVFHLSIKNGLFLNKPFLIDKDNTNSLYIVEYIRQHIILSWSN